MIDLLTKPSGDVTVTDAQNVDHTLPSMLQLISNVVGLTDDLTGAIAQAQEINSQTMFYSNEAHKSADAASASADAAAQSAANLSAAVTEATSQAVKSATSASESAMSAAASASSRTAADASRDAAKASETAAASSRDNAGFSAAAAQTYRDDAKLARDMADSYANAPVNSEVTPGRYSAYHWAEQARMIASGALIYKGSWDASGGKLPTNPKLGDFYLISKGGTVGSVKYSAGDMTVFDGVAWDRIDNQQSVTSVAGRTGAVTLTAADIEGGSFPSQVSVPSNFTVRAQGVEGAEIRLLPGTDSTISGEYVIDTTGGKIRFWESGGTKRGAYVDITQVPDGLQARIWHNQNFDPGSKADINGPLSKTGKTSDFSLASSNQVVNWDNNTVGAPVAGTWGSYLEWSNNGNRNIVSGAWINRISASTQAELYFQQSVNGSAFTSHYKIWTEKNFDPTKKLDTSGFTWAALPGKPTTFAPSAHTHAISEVTGLQTALDDKLGAAGGNVNGSIVLQAQTSERQFAWQFSDRSAYFFSNPTTKAIGLYDNVGGFRWTTDTAGHFYATGNVNSGGGYYITNSNYVVMAPGSAGTIYLRPYGMSNSSQQATLGTDGTLNVSGGIQFVGGNALLYGENNGYAIRVGNSGVGYRYYSFNGNNGDFTVANGWCYANNFKMSSDGRLKKYRAKLRAARELERIKKLVPQVYLKCGKQEFGFVAQELREVFPTMVTSGDGLAGPDTLSISYSELIAPIVAAIQELDRRMTEAGI